MYAQCPQCNAVFRVSDQQLSQAVGRVRCGECHGVFWAAPVSDQALRALRRPAGATHDVFSDKLGPLPTEEPPVGAQENLMKSPAVNALSQQPKIPLALRTDLIGSRRSGSWGKALWMVGIMALTATLLAQVIYFERDLLMRHSAARPYLQELCAVVGCDLQPQRDVTQIELLSRRISSHAQIENALMITGRMINQAPFAQPYPALELRLSDLQGRVVAARRFSPEEYLQPGLDPNGRMAPDQPVVLGLEVLDPGGHAMTFEFEFI